MNSERKFAEEIQRFVKIFEKEKIEMGNLEQKESKSRKIINDNLIPMLKSMISSENDEYYFSYSIGKKTYCKIPWISICKKVTIVTKFDYKKEINIKYLFTSDLKGIYLSLNQGFYSAYNDMSAKKHKFFILSKYLQKELKSIPEDMKIYNIDLKIGVDEYAKDHEKSYILGKYYDIDNLPNDNVFASDFNKMIEILNEATGIVQKKREENGYDSIYDILYSSHNTDPEYYPCSQIKDTTEKDKGFETKERNEVPTKTEGTIKTYPRNEEFVKVILEENNYKCEVNENHKTFINETTKEQYMEAHHLIPMKEYETYEKKGKCIDVLENMCCICPNCHRRLHHGVYEDKEDILKKLHTKKEILLKEAGLEISFDELKKYYKKTF